MRRLLYYMDFFQVLTTCLRIRLAPQDRPIAIGLFVKDSDLRFLPHAVCPESVFIRVNYARQRRGWDGKAFGRLMRWLRAAACKRPIKAIVWGYRDRRDHGVEVERYFDDCVRAERALVNPPRVCNGAFNTAFIVSDRSIYFDGRVSTEIERRLNQLTPGQLAQSGGQRLLEHVLASSLTKFPSAVQAARMPTDRDLLILGQCTGDQAIVQAHALARTNPGLADLVASTLLTDGKFENVYYKPHPMNRTTPEDLGHLRAHHPGIVVIDGATGIIPLLAGKPDVATLTSGAGLEAALRGCKVHVFGVPFYSHWGFTVDHMSCARRTNRLSPEDVFLFMVMHHTKYVDPGTGKPISALEAFGLTAQRSPARV
jgi:capsular polysaccharide export protein